MAGVGRMLLFCGGILIIMGLLLMVFGRTNLPLGKLPGDFIYRGKNTTFYFPLATCVLISVVLSIVFYVIVRLRR